LNIGSKTREKKTVGAGSKKFGAGYKDRKEKEKVIRSPTRKTKGVQKTETTKQEKTENQERGRIKRQRKIMRK
jgi:hypothetical protein